MNSSRITRATTALASVGIGILLAVALLWLWAYIAAYSPLPGLLVRNGFSSDGIWTVITASDFLMNVIVRLPAAWVLLKLGRKDLPANTFLAVAAFAVASSLMVGLPTPSSGLGVWIQYILLLASLPVAVWLLSKLSRHAPN